MNPTPFVKVFSSIYKTLSKENVSSTQPPLFANLVEHCYHATGR